MPVTLHIAFGSHYQYIKNYILFSNIYAVYNLKFNRKQAVENNVDYYNEDSTTEQLYKQTIYD